MIVLLLGMIFCIVLWFSFPYMKLNHLIVWLNRNRQTRECDWISDRFQSLLCLTKSKPHLTEVFTSVDTKNRLSFDSLFKVRIYVTLTIKNSTFQDDVILDEITESFVVSFAYRRFKWIVTSVE